MAEETTPNATQLFLATACSHSLLSAEVASQLSSEAEARGLSPSQLAVEKGVLDAVQVDIVETLLRPGEAIPGYQVLGLLGRGNMGIVYRARQTNLDRLVAVKTVLVSQLSQSGAVARFEKEALAVARLRHPNLVTAYDFGRHGGRLFFVMELLEGETLERRIDRAGRLDEATAWGLARQTASGLAHAAQMGIIHRDVKPANLILVEPPLGFPLTAGLPMVRITDFGLALLAHDAAGTTRLTTAGTTLGTPIYMAPEQFSSSDVDCRADIYALGATVYHMLTGRPPFAGATVWEVMVRKKEGLSALDPRTAAVSPESAGLVAAMTANDPARRIAGYQELLERIDRLPALRPGAAATPDPLLAAQPTLVFPVQRGRWPGWRRGALLALSLLALAGLLAGLWWRSAHPPTPPPTANLVPSGWVQPLYDGVSVGPPGWVIGEGSWTPAQDAEGGKVLSGRGVIRRQLPPLANYRILLGADLQKASAVELHFALTQSADGRQPRFVLRAAPDGVVLGRRTSDRATLEPLSPALPFSGRGGESPYHEMRVERHGSFWRASFDGEPVGSLPAPEQREAAEFRLVTEGGPAFFDALEVAELVSPER